MSNSYFSQTLRLVSRGIAEAVLAAPADVNIAPATIFAGVHYISPAVVNRMANANINAIGLFSNFADGLVFSSSSEPLGIYNRITALNYGAAIAGTSSSNNDFNQINGVGTSYDTQLVTGDYIMGQLSGLFYKVKDVVSPTKITVYGYYRNTFSGERFNKCAALGTIVSSDPVFINTLNEMYPIGSPNLITLFATCPAMYFYAIESQLYIPATGGVNLMTKSIDIAYNGKTVAFDAAIDFEYTPA